MVNTPTVKEQFEEILATFVASIKISMDAAQKCSVMAIEHYAEHDNLNWCQKFLDAMPKNFTRKAAYVKWLAAHAPITMVDGKFKKDKAEDAIEFNLTGAKAKPFWDFAPANEDILLTDEDAFKRLMVAIRYFRKDTVKTSEAVKSLVNDVEKLVDIAKLKAEQCPVVGELDSSGDEIGEGDADACNAGDDDNAIEATA